MLFNSVSYLLFFPVIVLVYFLTPKRYSWVLLLAGSYYFYMNWSPKYALLILTSTIITYYSGLKISDLNQPGATSTSKRKKRLWVTASFVSNLSILFFFKYLGFFNESMDLILQSINYELKFLNFDVLLPVGISFYTFQALSYTMDVYRGQIKAEPHFGKYALFVSFFPQLVAGPIERSTNLLPQLQTRNNFSWEKCKDGLMLIAWGLIKKMVIADRLALVVNEVYGNPTGFSGDDLIIATIFFSFQIYCDFSSYSDIAIGSAQVLGINLMKNFNRPYFATSIPDFWRRWHISLSTWFRDYLYIPLGGNRVSYIKWLRNIMVVFLVSGLWHGASWNFVIWGGIHGLLQVVSILTSKTRSAIISIFGFNRKSFSHRLFQILTTYSIVTFAWIFFRANTFKDSIYIIRNLFNGVGEILLFDEKSAIKTVLPIDVTLGKLLIISLIVIQIIQSKFRIRDKINEQSIFFRWGTYMFSILIIFFFGVYGDGTVQNFIYFQF